MVVLHIKEICVCVCVVCGSVCMNVCLLDFVNVFSLRARNRA